MRELQLLPRPAAPRAQRASARPSGRNRACERDAALPAQGFALETGPDAVRVRAADAAGERYARGCSRSSPRSSRGREPARRARARLARLPACAASCST